MNEAAARISADMRAFDASLDLMDHAVAAAFGISRTDLRAMELVSRKGSATAGELADQLHLTSGAVTGLIDRMEKIGFFKRNGDPADRRKVVVQLAPKAKEHERRAFDPLQSEAVQVLSRYSPEQLATISDFLKKARAMVERAAARVSNGDLAR